MTIGSALNFDSKSPPGRDLSVSPELAALRGCERFARLAPAPLSALSRSGTIKHYGPGVIIASEGSHPDYGFLVVRGRVRAVRRGENGREVTVEAFRSGDVNADAVLDPSAPLGADWVSAESTLLLVVPRDALLGHLQAFSEISVLFGQSMVRRLSRSKDLVAGLALQDVPSRVVWALRMLAEQDGQPVPEGVLIRQRPTQQELANVIGACRETVSRIVSDLVRQGLLSPRGRGLLVARRLMEHRNAA